MRELHSRVHKLRGMPGWVKREDELSFGISGPKLRKLLPLIEALKKEPGAVFYGSAYSNFILGAVQLLIENGIDYRLILKKAHTDNIVGNFKYLLRMTPQDKISWDEGHIPIPANFRIIPEGGEVSECLEGSKSLAISVLKNEAEQSLKFSKIIIDAGTGISALGLILGLSELNRQLPVHVFSMKLTESEFQSKLSPYSITTPVYFHSLICNKSFGAVTKKLLTFIDHVAQTEGFFLDPIYSGKLFYELAHTNVNKLLDDQTLIIHSGGALSLSGF